MRYEVVLRDKRTSDRRSIMFSADSFADAERQVNEGYKAKTEYGTSYDYFDPRNEEVIEIKKEWG